MSVNPDGHISVWAATSSWRGDLKLFARIVQKATRETARFGQPSKCEIEFAVRNDLESYDSVEDLLEQAPASTLRSFNSARIRVGGPGLFTEVSLGRKDAAPDAAFSCPFGVSIEVKSDGTVDQHAVKAVRAAVVKVVARGGFVWGKAPTEGPTAEQTSLEKAISQRWLERKTVAQAVFAAVAVLLFAGVYVAYMLIRVADDDKSNDGLNAIELLSFLGAVTGIAQIASFPFSTLIFPAIEIADVTPGRRILQVFGRSGVVTAAVGVLGAYLKAHLP